jgi:hypothetical protein
VSSHTASALTQTDTVAITEETGFYRYNTHIQLLQQSNRDYTDWYWGEMCVLYTLIGTEPTLHYWYYRTDPTLLVFEL